MPEQHDMILMLLVVHPPGNSAWKPPDGGGMHNSYNHMPIATIPNAQQHAVCQIPNRIYNWNLFNSSEKHPAAQSWTCGKVLATNLSSQWICLTSYLSRLHYFSQDETNSPFLPLEYVQLLFFCHTNEKASNENLFGWNSIQTCYILYKRSICFQTHLLGMERAPCIEIDSL